MRVDLPACNFENCRFNLDFNCINKRQFKECILKDLLNIKNIYKVDREEPIHYCEDYSMIVVAEDEEEPGIILAVVLGAHGVPVGATGTLQALRQEPARDQALARCTKWWRGS